MGRYGMGQDGNPQEASIEMIEHLFLLDGDVQLLIDDDLHMDASQVLAL